MTESSRLALSDKAKSFLLGLGMFPHS